ncbi:response regulator [Fibrisoma montanum]|uniref:Response regulator n=1 Tax=Fibrisoma montanum TaxID=2305895 RepID=A0A418M1B3_9BACT|nr:response regulator [Fibrisoma montanum]RIV19404.1 response regulator [Fibrisoma montanum]
MAQSSSSSEHVLLIDASESREILANLFESGFSHTTVVVCDSVEQAYVYIAKRLESFRSLPKLVFLVWDSATPEENQEALTKLKSTPDVQWVPIIVLSNSSQLSMVQKAYQLGANSYLIKPLGYDHWLQLLEALRYYWWEIVSFPNVTY